MGMKGIKWQLDNTQKQSKKKSNMLLINFQNGKDKAYSQSLYPFMEINN